MSTYQGYTGADSHEIRANYPSSKRLKTPPHSACSKAHLAYKKLCANIALDYYNDENDTRFELLEDETLDSYSFADFSGSWIHCSFNAKEDSSINKFFAELQYVYPLGPAVTTCVILVQGETRVGCENCKSVTHPVGYQGGFPGNIDHASNAMSDDDGKDSPATTVEYPDKALSKANHKHNETRANIALEYYNNKNVSEFLSKRTRWDYGLLPEEIWMEILLKLPVKSIIRASSVCKEWRSVIRSPFFINTHLSNAERLTLFRGYGLWEHYTSFGPSGIMIKEIEFPFEPSSSCRRIAGSCDGLVCLFDHSFQRAVVTIWNPSIRNHVDLPKSLINSVDGHFAVFVGFGVASNVYKVVTLIYRRSSSLMGRTYVAPPQAEVFSLGTGKWRRLTSASDVKVWVDESMWSPIFFKGVLHWIAIEPMSNRTKRYSILTFHVGDEVFGETMVPQELESGFLDEWILNLAIMGESLGAINCNDEMTGYTFDVWIMKVYGVKESWTRLYRIDTKNIEGVIDIEGVIGFWGSGEALLVVNANRLVTYNAKTKVIKPVQDYTYGDTEYSYMGDYKESLLLLGVESGCIGV